MELKIGCQPLFCESGCQHEHCTSALFYLFFAVKLCLIILVVNLYIVLVHLCTGVHAKSVIHCQTLYLVLVPEILYEKRIILNYVI